jgi:hypothetical protein
VELAEALGQREVELVVLEPEVAQRGELLDLGGQRADEAVRVEPEVLK